MEHLKGLIRERQDLIKKIKELEKTKKDDPEQLDREIKKTRLELIAAEKKREATNAQFLSGNCRQVDVLNLDNRITDIKQQLIGLEGRDDVCKAIGKECSEHSQEVRRIEKAIWKMTFEDQKKTFHNKIREEVEKMYAMACFFGASNAQAFARDVMQGIWGDKSFSAPDRERIQSLMDGLRTEHFDEHSSRQKHVK